jgi:hypothetical protein
MHAACRFLTKAKQRCGASARRKARACRFDRTLAVVSWSATDFAARANT